MDADRIGVIGICGGGCYSVSAAQIDHRIKAVATISMYDMGRARRRGVGDSMTYEQRMATLDAVGAQRTAEYGGAARRDIRALPEKVDASTPQYALDFLDYYDNPARGKHPNSTAYYSYTSLAPMMNFFPFVQIETISPRPLLFIVGEHAVSAYFSEDAYAKAAEPMSCSSSREPRMSISTTARSTWRLRCPNWTAISGNTLNDDRYETDIHRRSRSPAGHLL